jgi:hypothetical protein
VVGVCEGIKGIKIEFIGDKNRKNKGFIGDKNRVYRG